MDSKDRLDLIRAGLAGIKKPDDGDKIYADLRWAIGELERLQPVVAKLPKCWRLNEVGELVQDCPVVPEMEVWWPGEEMGAATIEYTDGYEAVPFADFANGYSTEAAAKAASKEEDR